MENDKNCPICLEEYSRDNYILKDSNDNHEIESDCKHWFCIHCLKQLYTIMKQKQCPTCKYNNPCPICRNDITELLFSYETSDSETSSCHCHQDEDEDEDEDDDSNERQQ